MPPSWERLDGSESAIVALNRWLSDDAMNDRYQRRQGELELELRFVLGRFAVVIDWIIGQIAQPADKVDAWERLGVESLVRDALEYNGDRRVRIAAMQCLAKSLHRVPVEVANQLVSYPLPGHVQRLAIDSTADVWLQSAALDVLAKIDYELFPDVVEQRLTRPATGDDLFVRRHCLRQAVEHVACFAGKDQMWETVVRDPSPAVRQQVAASLWQLPPAIAWPHLVKMITQDACHRVRAAALRESLRAVSRVEFATRFLLLLAERLKVESDPFCQRVALFVSVEWLRLWYSDSRDAHLSQEVQRIFRQHVQPAVWHVETRAADVPMRRWAAAAAEQLWVQLDQDARQLYEELLPRVQSLPRGRRLRIPRRLLRGRDADTIGRTLAVATQDDFGIELLRGVGTYYLVKQPQFGLRCWRVWNEFWHPATDKRQAHRHTIGRIPKGHIRAHRGLWAS